MSNSLLQKLHIPCEVGFVVVVCVAIFSSLQLALRISMTGGYSNRSVPWIGKESLYVSAVERRYLRTQPYERKSKGSSSLPEVRHSEYITRVHSMGRQIGNVRSFVNPCRLSNSQ